MDREAMKQPEALRLADALDAEFVQGRISNSTGRESAVELRRLALKQWVGLTDEEIWKCNKASGNAVEFHICYEHQNVEDFAEAIEAKLKEKNT